MKLKTAGVLAALIVSATGTANANMLFDIYAGGTVGIGAATIFADDHAHTDSAQSYGAVLGVDLPLVRIEGEYNYLSHKEMDMNIAMLNAYLKMPTALVQPYIGAGVGMIFDGDVDNTDIKIDDKMAYKGMLGLTFDIPVLPFKIDAEARALYAPDIYKISDIKPDVLHYDARVKIRYIF